MGPVLTPPQGYLLDLDGTLYSGSGAIPGAIEAVSRLRQQQLPIRLVTNTTSRSRAMLVQRLHGADVLWAAATGMSSTPSRLRNTQNDQVW